jgi:hypothetical protein
VRDEEYKCKIFYNHISYIVCSQILVFDDFKFKFGAVSEMQIQINYNVQLFVSPHKQIQISFCKRQPFFFFTSYLMQHCTLEDIINPIRR